MISKAHLGSEAPPSSFSELFADFPGWFDSKLAELRPTFIVGIARGAVRFLQIHSGVLPEGIPFLSHDALPFVSDAELHNARVLLFDDSVIYGSTMARAKEYLERRGAMVSCASYAVDRSAFYGESPDGAEPGAQSHYSWLPLHVKHRLFPPSIRLHHAALVHAILSTGLHYNLDFPSFSLRVPPFDLRDVPYLVARLAGVTPIRRIEDVSTPSSIASGLPRYSALLGEQDWQILGNANVSFRPYGKARLTVLPERGEIQLTPVLQLALSSSSVRQPIEFINPKVRALWRELLPPFDLSDPFGPPALFRLVTAFAGTVLGAELCGRVAAVLADAFSGCQISFIQDDARVVLGEANARRLASVFELAGDGHLGLLASDCHTPAPAAAEAPNAPALRERIIALMSDAPALRPCGNEMLCESVGKVFLAVRQATDSSECRRADPTASRLDTGLTYESIRAVLARSGRQMVDGDELSLTVDMCIDRGLVVPKVIQEGGAWFRAFYFGEGEDDQDPLQFKNAFHRGYSTFLRKRGTKPLTPFDVQKLCVALKDVMPSLPISTKPYTYGFAGFVGDEQLIGWLSEGPSAPCTLRLDGNRQVVDINREYIAPVKPVWRDGRMEKEFFDALDFTATAFLKMSDSEKLLLTTCRTHRHVFNAVAFEAHMWGSFEKHGFGALLMSVEKCCREGGAAPEFSACSLYWCVRYLSEALKKYWIFHRDFGKLAAGAKRAFCTQGDPARRWWEYLERMNLLDPKHDGEIERRFSHLTPMVGQMQSLSVFIARALDEAGLLPMERLESEFRAHGTSLDWEEFAWFSDTNFVGAAQAYNRKLDERAIQGRSIVTTRLPTTLPEGDLRQDWATTTLGAARTAFDELAKVLHEYCKQYKDDSFPFAPDALHKILDDGSTEERRDNVFLLTMDIIKGTNAEQTNRMKDEIRAALNSFQAKGLVFADTGDDAFVAVCDDPLVLWDAADLIRVRGDFLIVPGQAFGGTRKGLFFGSVAVIESPKQKTLVRDVRIPNTIPAACYILSGVDQHVENARRNGVLIIEATDTLPKCVGRLALDAGKMPRFHVSGKHFKGECVIVDFP